MINRVLITIGVIAAVIAAFMWQRHEIGSLHTQIEELQTRSVIEAAKSKAKIFEIKHQPKPRQEVHREINTAVGHHALTL